LRPAPPPFKVGWSAATCTVTICSAAQKSVQTRWHKPLNDEHSSRIRSGRARRDPPAMCCPISRSGSTTAPIPANSDSARSEDLERRVAESREYQRGVGVNPHRLRIGTAACADGEGDQAGSPAWLRMHIDHGWGDPARDRWDVSRRTAR